MRKGTAERKTKETSIFTEIILDGKGKSEISTGIPFLNHMLELFAKHSLVDLEVQAQGDIEVDFHHTVEDVGITIGKALNSALGKREGIKRFGWSVVPMDESLAEAVIDISGRAFFSSDFDPEDKTAGNFPLILINSFFQALSTNSKITLHIILRKGKDPHHIAEAIFKAFAKALSSAIEKEKRIKGAPSTKGVI